MGSVREFEWLAPSEMASMAAGRDARATIQRPKHRSTIIPPASYPPAAFTVLLIKPAIVMGPTPPGTGVMA